MNKVDVIMPVFNGQKYLNEAIESVLNQTFEDFVLTIVNDASTDESLAIIEEAISKCPKIRLINNELNLGMGESLNIAMLQSNSEYVARIDSDDLMLKNRLEKQVAYLNEHADVVVLGSRVNIINSESEKIGIAGSPSAEVNSLRKRGLKGEMVGMHHPSVMLRKKEVLEVGGYRGEFWPTDDIDLWNRIIEHDMNLFVMSCILTDYRVHSNSVSSAKSGDAELQKMRVKLCRDLRRKGEKELSIEDFKLKLQNEFIATKINRKRVLLHQFLYKKASTSYVGQNKLRPMFNIFGAFLLRPIKTTKSVVSRFSR